ncbi:response regulator [Wenzhouxiangella sp. XN201]|uniref:response regulator transcription factor n=1 Tax=Wenzhouxiangella sp. XN201 TaxID=2710755 RepID=UPI0013CBB483|nr:response regulator [Wenzhouxiangella sp. XN201]NEZ03950.1 response regulator [Wenzhouxiangella sp. XN201]
MDIQLEQALVHVVDDDEAVRSSLRLLGEARGWQIKTYASAHDYLAEPPSPQGRLECLVLDLQLPGMNGTQLLEMLRASDRQPATIVLTAWPDSELARRALAAGASQIIPKPFVPGAWLRAVEESLSPAN